MICTSCKSTISTPHYQLNRVDAKGATQGTVTVCSIRCLLSWTYAYGAQRTTMGVMMAKHVFGQVLGAIRGTPKNPG
jgi:hypothetical protein